MALFKKSSKSELVKFQEELSIVESTITEVSEKLNKYAVMLQGATLELELDDKDSGVKKRITKLEKATGDLQKELSELANRQSQLNENIASEHAKERQIQITEASKLDEEEAYRQTKINILANELYKLNDHITSKRGAPVPTELKRIAGLRYNEHISPAQGDIYEEALKSQERGKARAQEEVDKLLAQIKDIAGL
ncbi:hypothetical protein AB1K32_13320 [Metabacillus dongyingensis]|uniref:hypothetical protein n=1 Tax=Metabacillus dongyingensis TaxID=2874282 RepID=UPI003B8DBDAE